MSQPNPPSSGMTVLEGSKLSKGSKHTRAAHRKAQQLKPPKVGKPGRGKGRK
jgi:hypothetical protein